MSKWMFVVLPGLAMSLGWGLRGQLGHSTGAMVPGALAALVLSCLLPGKRFSRGMAVGLGAIAFGYGATLTTLNTAGLAEGLLHKPGFTLPMAFSGLAIKGALWALFGGIFFGLAFAARRFRWWDVVVGMILMVAVFHAGWWVINRPSPVFFSVDRQESYGGYVFSGIALLTWLTWRGRTKLPLLLGLCLAVAGALGYPFGVFLAGVGTHSRYVGGWHDWWKVAETTYGACMGVGLGIGALLIKDKLPEFEDLKEAVSSRVPSRVWNTILGLIICGAFTVLTDHRWGIHWLGEWLVLGSIMICLAYCFPKAVGWHIGVTLTVYVTARNVAVFWQHGQDIGNPTVLWILVWLLSLVIAWKVAGWSRHDSAPQRQAFVSLMWTIVTLTTLKTFVDHPTRIVPLHAPAGAPGQWFYAVGMGGAADQIVLVSMAIVLTWLVASIGLPREGLHASEYEIGDGNAVGAGTGRAL